MKEFYFTFGTRHTHPVTGISMENRWIRISAPDYGTARKCMALLYGPRWAFQYVEKKFNHAAFPEGEYLHITCENAEMDEQLVTKHNEALNGKR